MPIPGSRDLLPILPVSLLFFFFFFFRSCLANPRIEEVELKCGNTTSNSTNVIPNFTAVMRAINDQVTNHSWGSSSIFDPLPVLYGLGQCHSDLNQSDCLMCYAQSRTKLPSCLTRLSGRIYLDGCFLRYDSYNFFNESTDSTKDNFTCTARGTALASSTATLFSDRVGRVLTNVTATAIANKGYAIAGEDDATATNVSVYALAQCWKTVSDAGCKNCLENAASKIKGCAPGVDGRAMNAGCFLRYSTQKFYSEPGAGGSSNRQTIIIAAAVCAAVFSLVVIGLFIGYKKLDRRRQARRIAMRLPGFMKKSNLNYKYETLERATNFFDETRKLGQGAAGSVYKGILPSGKVVAVKRLVFNTRQWVDDFFNEVNLISGIQHRNLVKLLGCSIEGPESLLVYEYVPKRSLDQILFTNDPTHALDWDERLNVIKGTAEGLAFLHSGSCGLKILHRDIKTSNILLDENLTAKIADFGLVRSVAPDRSHLTTGIAGTLGYMAPEYLVRGQLTEKADVYSFGVLVLEILTGRKNTVFTEGVGSVLQTVWRNYKSDSLHESMDPTLRGNFPNSVAANVLQIGLLCTQASAELRPWMTEVVLMLSNKHGAIPAPKQPPFLNASVLNSSGSTRSSISTGASNQLSGTSISSGTTGSSAVGRTLSIDRAIKVSEPR